MRYHNITKDDMLNGDGLRAVLWVAGCCHGCEDCQNPVTWDINGGLPFDDAAKNEVYKELSKSYISGITMSGGDPLHPANRVDMGKLITDIKKDFPDKTIWLYTGYLWEEIRELSFIKDIDVLVDGKYDKYNTDQKLKWKGSSNQRVIDVPKSMALCGVCLYDRGCEGE